ncbi:MAG TPA: Gfo/Idh/MocA family oxidoreductase [Acidimicrobiales bacterium]|nr:Gfo/Idh/MocA family oxidoreductase [Acidimicrobiales bacterium]
MTLRIGFIGCGWIAGAHSRSLKALIAGGVVDAQVVAASDPHLERAQAFAGAHGADIASTDPADVLAAVDVVWICTPTGTHRGLVEAAAAAGVAIYCEKPLAPTIDDVTAMAAAVERAGVANQVGLVLRAEASFLELHRLLHDGTGQLGAPMTAILRDDQFFPIQGQYVTSGGGVWRADVAQAGGGALLEHSIHDLDALAWLLGPIVEVACRTANFAGHVGIEDVATATLVHDNGVTSTLVSVWHDVLSRPSTRRLEVFCQKALLWVDREDTGPVHVETNDGTHALAADTAGGWIAELPLPDDWRQGLAPYAVADRAFLEALAAGRPGWPGFDAAVAAHHVADAAYRSAASGGVPVPVALR